MKKLFIVVMLAFCQGCSTINVTTSGDVLVDAHKNIVVSDPTATVGVPLI